MSWQKRTIPTLVALILLVALLFGLVVGTSQVSKLFSQATSQEQKLVNVLVSNLTDTGWTVSWTTPSKTTGVVYFGKTEKVDEGLAIDDRDVRASLGQYTTHFVTVRNARPGGYFFKIGVDKSQVGEGRGLPFTVTVPTGIAVGESVDPIYGQVTISSGGPAVGAIVGLYVSGAQVINSYTGKDGSYVLPLTGLRREDLKQGFTLSEDQAFEVKIIGEDFLEATISCLHGRDRPLPPVRLGETVTCSQGFVAPPSAKASPQQPVITLKEGETVDQLPTFSGRVGPSQEIKITVESSGVISAAIVSRPDGTWSWTPPATLPAGEHTITISVTNPDGTLEKIKRRFVVLADTALLPVTSGSPSGRVSPPPPPPPTKPKVSPPPPPVAIKPPPPPPPPAGGPPRSGDPVYTLGLIGGGIVLLIGAVLLSLRNLL